MTTLKQRTRELKGPDDFQKLGREAVPFLIQHQKTLAVLALGLAGAGLLVAVMRQMSSRSEDRAAQGLAKALAPLERGVGTEPEASPAADPAQAPFKSEAERDQALISSLRDFQKSAQDKPALLAQAAWPLGFALLKEGQFDEALAEFERALGSVPSADPLRLLALEGKGYAQEGKKQWAEAAATFEALAKAAQGDFMKGVGGYHQARMLFAQGKQGEAMKLWAQVKSQAANTHAGRLSEARLNALAASGVVLPAEEVPAAKQ